MNNDTSSVPAAPVSMDAAAAAAGFFRGVYGWMAAGLAITAVVAGLVATSPSLIAFFVSNTAVFFVLVVLELVAVGSLSLAASKMSSGTATGVFLLYSILNGLTLSFIFLVYAASSIAGAFLVAALMFAAMSVYGMVTKKDLSTIGRIAFMGLIGIIVASLVNMFLANSGLDQAISYIGVLVFTALTAYDTQKLRRFIPMGGAGEEQGRKMAILGALTLYLDFINLFLMLLRIMGKERRS